MQIMRCDNGDLLLYNRQCFIDVVNLCKSSNKMHKLNLATHSQFIQVTKHPVLKTLSLTRNMLSMV